jgi:hypothetical protein
MLFDFSLLTYSNMFSLNLNLYEIYPSRESIYAFKIFLIKFRCYVNEKSHSLNEQKYV